MTPPRGAVTLERGLDKLDMEGWKALLGKVVNKVVVLTAERLEIHLVIGGAPSQSASNRSIQPSTTLSTLSRAVNGSFNSSW